ncbi:MAG: (Fe-S)-binding protein [Chitinophagales bacterium]|nr:(Fe-S)-binding protein [Chitinophagales bacterium]
MSEKIQVQLFIPCFVDQLYPETGMNMVKVLEKLGCEVSYNAKQTCCGQPAFNAGYWDESRSVAKKFVNDFEGNGYVVGPSGSCTGFVRNYYDRLLENSSAHVNSHQLSNRMFEFTEFLTNILKVEDIGATLNGKATYHDACGALRECGIKEGPRKLLQNVKGLEMVEMKECETCCGFGGTFSVKYEPISIGMAQTKVQSALDTGAEYMITTDVSCMMHVQGYIDNNKLPIRTMHIADVLASGW